MTTDLTCLVLNALWGVMLVYVEGIGKTRSAGVAWNAGNRDVEPKFSAWIGRAGRALANHKENFPLFLTAVVVVHLAGKADATSAMAALVYVVARVAHGLLYIAGVKLLFARSLAFAVGFASLFVILSRLV